jgi:hypothetical protein
MTEDARIAAIVEAINQMTERFAYWWAEGNEAQANGWAAMAWGFASLLPGEEVFHDA